MIKIGFIDYFLDEWHANQYPAWIKEASGGKMEVAFAYAMADSPLGGLTTDGWCEKNKIQACATIEEVIGKSDGLVILSPDNSEFHERLSELPVASGKPCYVDKTFAPSLQAAKNIFKTAGDHDTPCYSTSALRFAEEYQTVDTEELLSVSSWGGGSFQNYTIHQLEPLMMLMKTCAKRVLCTKDDKSYTLNLQFADGRRADLSGFANGSPFMMNITSKKANKLLTINSDFFKKFIAELVAFFETKEARVDQNETLAIMAAWDAAQKAYRDPGNWIEVERLF